MYFLYFFFSKISNFLLVAHQQQPTTSTADLSACLVNVIVFVHKKSTLSIILYRAVYIKFIHAIMSEKDKTAVKNSEDPVAKRVHDARGPVGDWAERPMNDSHRDKLQEIDGGWIVSDVPTNHYLPYRQNIPWGVFV